MVNKVSFCIIILYHFANNPYISSFLFQENLSDSEFNQRHSKCEIIERQKFISILAEQAWSNSRRGARRSRNNSIGGTPEPHSPEATVQQESAMASHNSSAAPSPVPPSAETLPTVARYSERRRASSVASETFSDLADDQPALIVQSWTRRTFPLTEDEVTELGEKIEDPVPPAAAPIEVEASQAGEDSKPVAISGVSTPDMESSDGELVPEDDPNDPEWTVITMDSKPKKPESTTKTTLVLKLAKR